MQNNNNNDFNTNAPKNLEVELPNNDENQIKNNSRNETFKINLYFCDFGINRCRLILCYLLLFSLVITSLILTIFARANIKTNEFYYLKNIIDNWKSSPIKSLMNCSGKINEENIL